MRKHLKRALFGITFLCLMVSIPAFAANVKVGVISLQKIMQNSKTAKDARGAFLMDLESKRTVLRAKEGEVRKMEQNLRKEAKGKSPEALRKERDKIAQEVKSLRRLRSDLEEELKKKDAQLTRKLVGEIREVVNQYRKKKKFTLILEQSSVLAFDEAVDITAEIIKEFDKK